MRRIIMFNRVTPDGLFAASDGALDWAVPDDEVDAQAVTSMPDVDLMLFGRRTYEMFASFWPGVLDQTAPQDPHRAGRASPQLHAMAEWLNATPKWVFSRTLTHASWHGSHIAGAFDPAAIRALTQQPGKDIIVFGSGTLVSLLTEHGLIDEYRLLVNPLLLGGGRPLFTGLSHRVPLRLDGATPYASGNVMLRYQRGAVP